MESNMETKKKWIGTPPAVCDVCEKPITDVFIDGLVYGQGWANMCPACHRRYGAGLGTGKGQKYVKESDGWVNVERTTK